jgi:hypothetical protein
MTKDEALRLALEALEESHPEAYRHTITAIKAALEQPEPEPVAWMNKHGACISAVFKDVEANADEYNIPLYTTPPKREWVGLTDEERIEIRSKVQVYTAMENIQYGLAVQHATEAKLKELNT